jgi:hypothetical protein
MGTFADTANVDIVYRWPPNKNKLLFSVFHLQKQMEVVSMLFQFSICRKQTKVAVFR